MLETTRSLTELAAELDLPAGWLEARAKDGSIPSSMRGPYWQFDAHQVRMALVRYFALGRSSRGSSCGLLLTRDQFAEAIGLPRGLIDRLVSSGVLATLPIPGAPRFDLLECLDALRTRYGRCAGSVTHQPRKLSTLREFAQESCVRRADLDELLALKRLPHFAGGGKFWVDSDFASWYLAALSMRFGVEPRKPGESWAERIDRLLREGEPRPKKKGRRSRSLRKNFPAAPYPGRRDLPPIDTETPDAAAPDERRHRDGW